MTFFNSAPRTRLIALLIVAAFSISAVAVATGYVAAPASAAKKKKKCKKGYKKVKGKCKKKKKAATTLKVEAVMVSRANGSAGQVDLMGQIKTNISSAKTLNGEVTVTVGGATQKIPTVFKLSSTRTLFSKKLSTSFGETDGGTVTVTVEGVTSAPRVIK